MSTVQLNPIDDGTTDGAAPLANTCAAVSVPRIILVTQVRTALAGRTCERHTKPIYKQCFQREATTMAMFSPAEEERSDDGARTHRRGGAALNVTAWLARSLTGIHVVSIYPLPQVAVAAQRHAIRGLAPYACASSLTRVPSTPPPKSPIEISSR